MYQDIYNCIVREHPDCLEPISRISKAEDKPEFIASDLRIINFDRIAKKKSNELRSPDGLYFQDEYILFLEFKDRKFSDVKIGDRCKRNKIRKGIKGKIYEGLSLFSSLLYSNLTKLNIKCVIICNPSENIIQNPAQGVLQNRIYQKEMIDVDELRTMHMKETLETYFSPLSNININFEFEIIISHDRLDKFINSLS